MKRLITTISAVASLCAAAIMIFSCADADDTDRIRRIIERAAAHAEENDIAGVLEDTSEGFTAQSGRHDRRAVKRLLWLAFRHYGRLSILYPQPAITIADDRRSAVAEMFFLVVKQDRSVPDLKELAQNPQKWLQAVGENADLYRLRLDLIYSENQWKVIAARLDPYVDAAI